MGGGECGTTEFFEHDFVLQQLLSHFLDVRGRQIDFVDGNDHWHTRALRVGDGFDRLRHNLIVGGHNEHHDVSYLRTAGTHGGERLVTRCVEERDGAAVGQRHMVCADVLRNTACFARNNVGFADVIEQ